MDPYYLTYKAKQAGYCSQLILAGRRINDGMGKYVAEHTVKKLIQADVSIENAKVGLFGFTFKENCPDIRNTRVIDIVKELNEYGLSPIVFDPVADPKEAFDLYELSFINSSEISELDCIVVAVSHDEFKGFSVEKWSSFYKTNRRKIMLDVKGVFDKVELEANDFDYWRL